MAYQDPLKRATEELDALMEEAGLKPAPEVEPDPNPAPGDDGAHTEPPAPAEPQPEPQPPADPPAEPQPSPRQEESAEYWKSRFLTIQGMYKSELRRETAALTDEVNRLKREIETLTSAPIAAPKPSGDGNTPAENVVQRSPHVTDDIRKSTAYRRMAAEYGEQYAEMQAEQNILTAKAAAQSELQPIREEMAQDAQARFDGALTGRVPGWIALNNDPNFIIWTQETVAPYTNRTLNELLNEAYHRRDLDATAQIFIDYQKRNQQPAAPATLSAQPAPSPPAPDPTQQAMVAPPRRGSTAHATAENNNGKVWTMAEIEKFYAKLERDPQLQFDPKMKATQAEIGKALAEGRIVG